MAAPARYKVRLGSPGPLSDAEFPRYISRTAQLKASRLNRFPMNSGYDPSLFKYTSGRFLFREQGRLEERHVEFDVQALQHAAEASIRNKHGRVTSIVKFAEGDFNRVFTLVHEDGFEMIAKIPYKSTAPEYYATASEAATLTFLRSQDLPVPKVYGYCATIDNPVGVEYLLMEKAPGVSLESRWSSFTEQEIEELANSMVEIEAKLFSIRFGAIGSLYFKKDIVRNLQAPLYQEDFEEASSQFCIGPIADYKFWSGLRAGMDLRRRPWTSPADYLHSVAQREIEWTWEYGLPREPIFPHNAMGLGIQQPEEYIELLESYQRLAPHLLPKDPTRPANQPTLRHPDSSPGSIFICPDGRVSCLIDWQHAIVEPRLLAAGYRGVFVNPDDTWPVYDELPELPDGLADLPLEEQDAARDLHRRRLAFYLYTTATQALNPTHHYDLGDPILPGRQMLVDWAGRPWAGDLVGLQSVLVRAVQFWDLVPDVKGIACPVVFRPADLAVFAEVEAEALNASCVLGGWYHRIGMREKGWVSNEGFEEASRRFDEVRKEELDPCEEDSDLFEYFMDGWPFFDREDE